MRILIIDDSEDGRDIAEVMLAVAGYREVFTAGSAADAYRFLGIGGAATSEPAVVDLVLLDIIMPEVDGIEACARIRQDPRYSVVPIIMVTALGDMDSLANAFVAGASDYISKPLNQVELQARVRSALKLKSELDRRQAREQELLQILSKSGGSRAANWIDKTTGLFTGELAEAYLMADADAAPKGNTSVIALRVDRLDACRTTQGEAAAAAIVAKVAYAVRATAATVGVVAAVYSDGLIVLVAPEMDAKPARDLAEALRTSVAALRIKNSEAIFANHVTASVAVVTGRANRGGNRVHLLTRAISAVPKVTVARGDRVMSEYLETSF
jgi:sigma-B regulation protein RsbU (phosphoserine phosphatase)